MPRFIILLLVVLGSLSARGGPYPIGLNESALTRQLKTNDTAAGWRTGLGITGSGSGSPFTNLFDYGTVTITNASNTGYTLIQSNRITLSPGGAVVVSGAAAGSFTLYDDAGTNFVRQQAPATVASNLNVIWPDRPGTGNLYATASGTNVTLSYSNAAASGLSSPSGYFSVAQTAGTLAILETWMGGAPSTGIAGTLDWGMDVNGGSVAKSAAIDGGHPGIVGLTLPATTDNRTMVQLSYDNIAFGAGTHYLEWKQKFDTTLSGTPIWRLGFADNRVDLDSADAAYARYDSGSANWKLYTRSNTGTATETTSAQAVSTAWHVMGLKVNADASSAILYYNGAPIATNTTAIPTGFARSLGISFGGYRALTDGTSQIYYQDYLWYCFSPTTFP